VIICGGIVLEDCYNSLQKTTKRQTCSEGKLKSELANREMGRLLESNTILRCCSNVGNDIISN